MSSWGEYRVENGRQVLLLCPRCKLHREHTGQRLIRIGDPEGPHTDCFDCGCEMTHAEIWGATA